MQPTASHATTQIENARLMLSNAFPGSLRAISTLSGILALGASLVTALPGYGQQEPSRAPRDVTDTTCVACQNFYQYANKAWLDSASIPAASSNWGVWSANDARVLTQLHTILKSAAAAPWSTGSSSEQLLGMFDAGCMDSVRADRDGVGPLRPILARIDAMATPTDVIREIGRLHRDGVPAVFLFSSEVDRTGDLRYTPMIEQSGLILDPQDYLRTDSATVRDRSAYSAHVVRTFVLAGESPSDAQRDAERVLAIESALASASMTRMQEVDASVQQMFRHFTPAELKALTPGFSWDVYLRERRAPPLGSVILPAPAFVTAAAKLIATRPVSEWSAYLRWHLLSSASPFLSSPFADESFRFATQSSGTAVQTPRWQRCTREVGADLPELLGQAYIAHTFSPSSKARIDTMVKQIRAVLVERLRTVPWLTEPTRRQALEKASTFGVKIAYPDKWHDYSALRITPGPFIIQRTQARRFESDRLMARIGHAPDRAEWDFHGQYHFVPQSPTAWANWDEIIFPAAYLQPPLYDSTADLAENYAAIGVIIGHEMTHLFTADGGDIDAAGRIRHWWTPTDSARFALVQERLVHQYDRYTVLDSVTHVNGTLTLGENLADVGGVELAYAALERALGPHKVRHGSDTTPEMRFFLSYAHARVSKSRPEYLRRQLGSDGHAPSMFRVNGPLSNFAPFSEAFGCRPGDPMMRPDSTRVQIW